MASKEKWHQKSEFKKHSYQYIVEGAIVKLLVFHLEFVTVTTIETWLGSEQAPKTSLSYR